MSDHHAPGCERYLSAADGKRLVGVADGAHRARSLPNPDQPGLGTCTLCYAYTHLTLGLIGSMRWVAEQLVGWGIERQVAAMMVGQVDSSRKMGDGVYHVGFLVCKTCADEHGLEVANRFDEVGPVYAEAAPGVVAYGVKPQ